MIRVDEITVNLLCDLLKYDKETGSLTWKKHISHHKKKGCSALEFVNKNGYSVICFMKKSILAQKAIYAIVNGKFPDGMLFFKDGNGQNLKWDNLEEKKSVIGNFDHSTPESRKLYHKAYRDQNPGKTRNDHLKHTFGINSEIYERMFKEQNGLCACCDQPETAFLKGKLLALAVDHDHATGYVRSLLCRGCNVGLGSLRDSPELMRKAASYVEKHTAAQKHQSPNVIPIRRKQQ